MEESFMGLRRDIIQPFPSPTEDNDLDYLELWFDAEKKSRPLCEKIVDEWIRTKILPPIDDDSAAYFLIRRFDTASEFIKNHFLDDLSSVFSYDGYTTDEVLKWCLSDWWYEHGSTKSSWEDLVADEEEFNKKNG
eukprot:Seg21027.2 transcript_id=Seg21027.2/GoldUCD/mRNA.D3Y31 product="hypothetical protein" protein_id=Seg21027.2/GoldUCD/D3Y31